MPIYRLTAPGEGVSLGNDLINQSRAGFIDLLRASGAEVRRYAAGDVDIIRPHEGCATSCEIQVIDPELAIATQREEIIAVYLGGLIVTSGPPIQLEYEPVEISATGSLAPIIHPDHHSPDPRNPNILMHALVLHSDRHPFGDV